LEGIRGGGGNKKKNKLIAVGRNDLKIDWKGEKKRKEQKKRWTNLASRLQGKRGVATLKSRPVALPSCKD